MIAGLNGAFWEVMGNVLLHWNDFDNRTVLEKVSLGSALGIETPIEAIKDSQCKWQEFFAQIHNH